MYSYFLWKQSVVSPWVTTWKVKKFEVKVPYCLIKQTVLRVKQFDIRHTCSNALFPFSLLPSFRQKCQWSTFNCSELEQNKVNAPILGNRVNADSDISYVTYNFPELILGILYFILDRTTHQFFFLISFELALNVKRYGVVRQLLFEY